MGLADRLAAAPERVHKNSACQTCLWLDGLDQRDRDAVNQWVASGGGVYSLHRECVAEGLTVTSRNFAAHFEKGHHLEPR